MLGAEKFCFQNEISNLTYRYGSNHIHLPPLALQKRFAKWKHSPGERWIFFLKMAASNSQMWSAAPTPFTEDREIDVESVARMVEHHLRLGVDGLFLAGTCGEGPWMTDRQKSQLVHAVQKFAAGRLLLAVQVTDNSSARVLEQIQALEGVDAVIVAQPYLAMNITPTTLRRYYEEILDRSPIPVCYYERGAASIVTVPEDVLRPILSHPNLKMVKDSSGDSERRSVLLEGKKSRNDLSLLLGDEFRCVDYLAAGYNGVMLGGMILNARYVAKIMSCLDAGDLRGAQDTEQRMIAMLHAVYGGPKVPCWLNGLKTTLVRMGVFRTNRAYLDYPLTPECSEMIDRVLVDERDLLLPQ